MTPAEADLLEKRLVVLNPLLADQVNRAFLTLDEPENWT